MASRMALSVDGVLGEGGALAAALPGFTVRAPQLALARAVERALREGRHLVAEAGTGTGKTFGYLVPAVLSGLRVVISTATHTLQEQLIHKDIPLLREGVGLKFEAALLKGRANYLCAQRFEAFDAAPQFDSPEAATPWPDVRQWALRTDVGDRGEAPLPDGWPTWERLSTTSDTCLGSKCPLYEPCFVTRARARAQAAQVVVVNHALFFADLALKRRGGDEALGVLPAYDAVIFDEAHALEDVATEHFGTQLSSARLLGLANDALKVAATARLGSGSNTSTLTALAMKVRDGLDHFSADLLEALGLVEGQELRLTAAMAQPLQPLGRPLREALAALGAFAIDGEGDFPALGRRAQEAAAALGFLLAVEDPSHVYWASRRGRTVWLRAAPIEVGTALAQHLYGAVDAVVLTSATLTSAREARGGYAPSFDFVAERFGLKGASCDTLRLDSPFDFPRQAALYLPTHLPQPTSEGFVEAAAQEVLSLCSLTGGRAFVLFTSYARLDAVHARVAPELDVQVLKQGDAPRRALLEAFRAQPSVLFAAQSFWEGVDVPGDALSLVIIDRLPFQPPNEPLVAARGDALKARGLDPFEADQVPRAALALRQGFGRLIRTTSDRGIVAILDVRVTQKRYGKAFLESLPPARRLFRLNDVARWWGAQQSPG